MSSNSGYYPGPGVREEGYELSHLETQAAKQTPPLPVSGYSFKKKAVKCFLLLYFAIALFSVFLFLMSTSFDIL